MRLPRRYTNNEVREIEEKRPCETRAALGRVPLEADEIQGKELRDGIQASGCCGIAELLKLQVRRFAVFR